MEAFEPVVPDELHALLVTKTAIKTLRSETLVQKVIGFQFSQARKSFRNVGEVEISGFGRFVESPHKIRRKLDKFIKIVETMLRSIDEKKVDSDKERVYRITVVSMLREIFYLRTKLRRHEDRLQRDFGGRLELSFCEGKYREGSEGQDGDLSWLFQELGSSEAV